MAIFSNIIEYNSNPVVFWFHGPTALHLSGVSAATAFPPFAQSALAAALFSWSKASSILILGAKSQQLNRIFLGILGLFCRSMVLYARGPNFSKHNHPQLLISFSYCGVSLSQQKDFSIFAFFFLRLGHTTVGPPH